MKGFIKKNPWLAVIGAAAVGGLFLSNFFKGGASKVKRAL